MISEKNTKFVLICKGFSYPGVDFENGQCGGVEQRGVGLQGAHKSSDGAGVGVGEVEGHRHPVQDSVHDRLKLIHWACKHLT